MKPLYYVIIAVVVIIIIAVVVRNKNKQSEADSNVAYAQNSIINGDSSNVASVLTALFPYAQLGGQVYQQNQPKK